MKTPKTLELLPGESRVFAFNYGRQKEITEGLQTLLSAIITEDPANADLTISSPVVGTGPDAAKIKATYTVAANATPTKMQIFCDATTSAGAILGMVGNLDIVDPDSLEETA